MFLKLETCQNDYNKKLKYTFAITRLTTVSNVKKFIFLYAMLLFDNRTMT